MPLTPEPRPGRGLLAWTAAGAVVVCLASLGLVHGLTRVVPTLAAGTPRLAGTLRDPEVTGSIAPGAGDARSVSLDPCSGRERLIVRGPHPAAGTGRADNAD